MDPAAALVALAEEELRLVLDGRWEELDDLHERRAPVLAVLGNGADHELLRRAAALQELVAVALTERIAEVRAALVAGSARRDAAAGYARSAA